MSQRSDQIALEHDILLLLEDVQLEEKGDEVIWVEESALASALLGSPSRRHRRIIRTRCESMCKRGKVVRREYQKFTSWRLPDDHWPPR